MNSKIKLTLAFAALLAALIMLPSPLNAQHVITRPGTQKQKTDKETTTKRDQTSSQKGKSQQKTNNSKLAPERKKVLNNLINNMVYVSGGTFTMGATAEQGDDAWDEEKPTHQVALSSFYIGKYEVTQREWQAVMGSNPSLFKGDDRPVDNVSWNQCRQFINKLNSLTGKRFRLPTEAEWEFAARGGNQSRGYKYSGSDNIDNVAWYDGNSGNKTHNVGTKAANELGLYDMSGNIYEWCNDWYGDYSSSAQTNPTGPSSGAMRVERGGCWCNTANHSRIARRNSYNPSRGNAGFGLRLAM